MKQASIWVHVIWAVTAVLCCIIIFGTLGWIFSPTDWKFTMRMEANDNMAKFMDEYNLRHQLLDPIGGCTSVSDCMQNSDLDGCTVQADGVNLCCRNSCTLLGVVR
jgi:hypothetical protein